MKFKNKKIVITGAASGIGKSLAKLLLNKGYKVIGGERRSASGTLWRLRKLNIEKDIEITDFELSEFTTHCVIPYSSLKSINKRPQ